MNKFRTYHKRFTRALKMVGLCLVLCSTAFASDSIVNSSIFDLLGHNEVVAVTLEGDISHLRENKRSKKEVKATLSFIDGEGVDRTFKTNLTIRGKYRRMFSEGVPPLRLDFKKKELEEAGLSKYDDMKLVTMFHEDKAEAFQTLVKEYLAYKLYNEVTDYSYRVQLIEVNYADSNTGQSVKEYGFLIEDSAQFADRHNMKKVDDINDFGIEKVDRKQLETLSLFQYMIGNGDWGLTNVKNIKLYEKDGKLIPIPYDFDFSGLVDASYAVPNNIYNITNVKERVYLGGVEQIDDLSEILQFFKEKKEDFLKITSECKFLSKKHREEATEYLLSFYEDMSFRETYDAPMNQTLRAIKASR